MQTLKENFGQLDALVNCAGIAFAYRLYNANKLVMSDLENYRKTLDASFVAFCIFLMTVARFQVNVLGTINVIRHAVHLMMEKKIEDSERGVIINTASVAAFDGQIGQVRANKRRRAAKC